MASPKDFSLSQHAIERLIERSPEFRRQYDLIDAPALKKKAAYDLLIGATEEKGFKNCTAFTTFLHERYGYDTSFSFFVNGDMIFVGVTGTRGSVIVTTVSRKDHVVRQVRNPVQKYTRREDRLAA